MHSSRHWPRVTGLSGPRTRPSHYSACFSIVIARASHTVCTGMCPAQATHPREPSAVSGWRTVPAPEGGLSQPPPHCGLTRSWHVVLSQQVWHTTFHRPTANHSCASGTSLPATPHSWQWNFLQCRPDASVWLHAAPHASAFAARSANRCCKQRTVAGVPRLQPVLPQWTPFLINAHTRLECPVSALFAERDWKRVAVRV